MYVLLANPNATAATVRATYILRERRAGREDLQVAANSRYTIDVAGRGSGRWPTPRVSVQGRVDQRRADHRRAHDVVAGLDARGWTEGHNAFGTTRTAPRWLLAEGEKGGARAINTFVLIANTSAADANVSVTMLFGGRAPRSR